MHKNKVGLLAAGLLVGALAVGCAHKNPLVGTWTGSSPSRFGGAPVNVTLTLTDDGKDTMSTQGTTPMGPVQIAGSGTYTVSGDTLTQTFTTLTFNGQRVPQSKGPIPEPSHFTLNGDTLTLTNQRGRTQVFTRQKS